MEDPTVSALIHAATMVTAEGLPGRKTFPMFIDPRIPYGVAYLGGFTALLQALWAL